MNTTCDVSIIIVNYNTRDLTFDCLRSIYEQTKDISFEVIVSDNGSTDGSIEMIAKEFPQAILIENNANIGFGSANNKGLYIAKGKYIFYLNSDTVLLNNAVKMFFDYWENSEDREQLGALGGVLLDHQHNTIHSGGIFPSYISICINQMKVMCFHLVKSLVSVFHLTHLYQKIQRNISLHEDVAIGDIDYVTGADLFMKNNDFARFDETFFLYYEETDLQYNIAKKGLSRRIISGPRIVHFTRKLDRFNISSFSTICSQNSAVYYVKKNLGGKALLLSFLIFIDRLNPFVKKHIKR